MVMLASARHIPIADLPVEAHVIVAAFTILGLIFWIWGRKFLKAGFVVLGVLAGGAFGYLATVGMGLAISPILPAVGLGVLGMLFGWMAFRFAVAISMGALLTVAAPLIVLPIVMNAAPDESDDQGGPLSPDQLLLDDVPIVDGELPTETRKVMDSLMGSGDFEEGGEELKVAAEDRIRAFMEELYIELEAEWLDVPARLRMLTVLGGFLTFATGFGLGMLMPKYASGLLAASVGSAVWLPGLIWLGQAVGLGLERVLPASTLLWVCVWILLAVIGAFMQWRSKRRRADKGTREYTS